MSATPKGKAAPPVEKKAAGAPVITPQVLGIGFGIILLIGVIAYYQLVVNKYTNEIDQVKSSINATDQQISTYRKKGGMKDTADELNKTIRAKLSSLGYLFLEDQNSVVPFWTETFFPLILSGILTPTIDSAIEVEPYEFQINMAMDPFNTLPGSAFFEDEIGFFPIRYFGEVNGVPTESPLDTRPGSFLSPYSISLLNMNGTYEDCKRFIDRFQKLRRDKLMTIHCVINDPDSVSGLFRSSTNWSFEITVYFMNPDAAASGSSPPEGPGSRSC